MAKSISQPAGFEPARGNPIEFQVQRPNQSVTIVRYFIRLVITNLFFGSQKITLYSLEPTSSWRLKRHRDNFYNAIDVINFSSPFENANINVYEGTLITFSISVYEKNIFYQ